MQISRPVNDTQRDFNQLCDLGGGMGGGPARGRVQELLRQTGQTMNSKAHAAISEHFALLLDANPWHVCFAIGISWGRLAHFDEGFTRAAVRLLSNWNDADLKEAARYAMERGPDPITQTLTGGYSLFGMVRLPDTLPTTLTSLSRAQERWLSPIIRGCTARATSAVGTQRPCS